MRVNHLIIGSQHLERAAEFYINLFGFKDSGVFVDSRTKLEGRILTITPFEKQLFQLLLVPFSMERLPNPQHLALEVNSQEFEAIYDRAKELGLKIRTQPDLHCEESEVGHLVCEEYRYQNFYVLDPSGVNIEVMSILSNS